MESLYAVNLAKSQRFQKKERGVQSLYLALVEFRGKSLHFFSNNREDMTVMKIIFALFASGCLMALPAAATPDIAPPSITGVLSSVADKTARAGVIRIGDHFCPTVPKNAISDKMKKTLTLVSTTCVMEASGLIAHEEAQSVYEQALNSIQTAMSDIQFEDESVVLTSK